MILYTPLCSDTTGTGLDMPAGEAGNFQVVVARMVKIGPIRPALSKIEIRMTEKNYKTVSAYGLVHNTVVSR